MSPPSKTLGSHNPCAKDSSGAVYVRISELILTLGVGQGWWYMAGPGLEWVWNRMERGLERTGPGLSQNWRKSRAASNS